MAVRSAREAAYETIRSRIITMELKPGDELNDHALAQDVKSYVSISPASSGLGIRKHFTVCYISTYDVCCISIMAS